MRITALVAASSLLFLFARSPQERTVTDPQTVVSQKNDAAKPIPIEDLYFTRSVSGASWSPDGKEIVFTTNLTGRFNLWKVSSDGGWPLQLVQSDDRQQRPVWSPDGKWILWQQDHGGDEMYDLFAIPAGGGATINLTNTPATSESAPLFSEDSKQLAFASKRKEDPSNDVAVLDLTTKQIRSLTHETSGDRNWQPFAWSADGKAIYANRGNIIGTDGDIYRIDAATGAAENLTAHSDNRQLDGAALSPDGKTILAGSDEKGGYRNVALLDIATKKLRWVTDLQWEADPDGFSPDGKWLTYVVNEDGRQDIYLAPAGGAGQKLPLPPGINVPAGTPSAFSPDGRRLLVAHQSATTPGDFWVYDIGSGKTTQLTHSALVALDAAARPETQLVHYKSFDGTIISALMWVPFNLERNGKNPAVVVPHGGPTGQTTESFSRQSAALVTRGFIVIAPNVRGSTGYGQAFQKMNVKDLGGGDLQDEVWATKFLVATGFVDPKKIGITGGSYGGYMTLMAIGKVPDVFAAAVSQYGIVDWYTMLQHEDPLLQEYEKSLLGDPVKDKAIYEAASPIKYLGNAKAPLLVLQGENDIRVPKEEAEQVVSILEKNGRTVDSHFYPAEGHGFVKRENQIDATRRTVAWLEKYLK